MSIRALYYGGLAVRVLDAERVGEHDCAPETLSRAGCCKLGLEQWWLFVLWRQSVGHRAFLY